MDILKERVNIKLILGLDLKFEWSEMWNYGNDQKFIIDRKKTETTKWLLTFPRPRHRIE